MSQRHVYYTLPKCTTVHTDACLQDDEERGSDSGSCTSYDAVSNSDSRKRHCCVGGVMLSPVSFFRGGVRRRVGEAMKMISLLIDAGNSSMMHARTDVLYCKQ
jgi:hypothetical protein